MSAVDENVDTTADHTDTSESDEKFKAWTSPSTWFSFKERVMTNSKDEELFARLACAVFNREILHDEQLKPQDVIFQEKVSSCYQFLLNHNAASDDRDELEKYISCLECFKRLRKLLDEKLSTFACRKYLAAECLLEEILAIPSDRLRTVEQSTASAIHDETLPPIPKSTIVTIKGREADICSDRLEKSSITLNVTPGDSDFKSDLLAIPETAYMDFDELVEDDGQDEPGTSGMELSALDEDESFLNQGEDHEQLDGDVKPEPNPADPSYQMEVVTAGGKTHRYGCPIKTCGASFATHSSMVTHCRVHKKDVPFKCHHFNCTKRFGSQSGLEEHMKTHALETPFMGKKVGRKVSKACACSADAEDWPPRCPPIFTTMRELGLRTDQLERGATIMHYGKGVRGTNKAVAWIEMTVVRGLRMDSDVGRVFVGSVGSNPYTTPPKYSIGCVHWQDTIALLTG